MFINHYREKDCDVTQPKIAVYKHQCKTHQNTRYGCNLSGGQEVKRGLYSKTYQSPTVPQRIVLKPNLHHGRQDTTSSTRECPSTVLMSTKKFMTVERTKKRVAVK